MTLGSILILAGRRPGAVDALAEAHGVADKCLVPVAGRPMIAHVLDSAAATDAAELGSLRSSPDIGCQLVGRPLRKGFLQIIEEGGDARAEQPPRGIERP